MPNSVQSSSHQQPFANASQSPPNADGSRHKRQENGVARTDRSSTQRSDMPQHGVGPSAEQNALTPPGTPRAPSTRRTPPQTAAVLSPRQALERIAASKEMGDRFSEFLQNVLMQVDPAAFSTILRSVSAQKPSFDDAALYQALQSGIARAKPGTFGKIRDQLRALRTIQDTLVGQIGELTARNILVNGYAEIGYPARLQRHLCKQNQVKITGETVVMTDAQRLSDHIEAGFPRPNKKFITLDDQYTPIDKSVADESLDMVVCPIGLHHAPADKLPAFVDSIVRVMRPGASFILRDHDVPDGNATMATMAHAAHTVFNATTGVPWEDEAKETRNFRGLRTWQTLLDAHGLTLVGEPRITQGDPSRNALMRFVKRGGAGRELEAVERQMRQSAADYVRPQNQTYLTTLEWHLVHTASEGADFAADHAPQSFPYLKHVGTLWKTFRASMREARAAGGKIASEYLLMNLMMVACTTGEHLFRKLAYAPLNFLGAARTQRCVGAQQLATTQRDYAEFIKHTPFFVFPYMRHTGKMWRALFHDSPRRALPNLYMALVASLENTAKALFSAPLAWFYKDAEFNHIHLAVRDPDNQAEKLVPSGAIEAREGEVKALKVERYLPFQQTVQALLDRGVTLATVAGQRRIQVKVRAPSHMQDAAQGLPGCEQLGVVPIHTDASAHYVRLNVDVPALGPVLQKLRERGCDITYLHDF